MLCYRTDKKIIALCLLMSLCLSAIVSAKTIAKKDPAQPEAVNYLPTAQAMNSSDFASPPTSFRKGHVTHKKNPRVKTILHMNGGFTIDFGKVHPIATPAYNAGMLFTGGGFGSKDFYAFDAQTGKYIWGVGLDDDGPSSVVAVDGKVIFNTESCTLFVLDAKTGKQIWSLWLGDPLAAAPMVANNRVFTTYPARHQPGKRHPDATHVMAAFDLNSGKILWQKWVDADAISAPIADDDDVYITTFAGTVYRFEQKTGNILSASKSRATSAPTLVGDSMYVSKRSDIGGQKPQEALSTRSKHNLGNEKVYASKQARYLDAEVQARSNLKNKSTSLDAGNGFSGGAPAASSAEKALNTVGQNNVSSMQAYQGSRILNLKGLNIAVMGDEVVATDAKTEKTKWKSQLKGDLAKTGGFLGAPAVAVGDHLIIATYSGNVLKLNAKTGEIIQTWQTGHPIRYQPIVMHGRIYVGTQDGKLVSIATQDNTLTGWAMWGANAGHTGKSAPFGQ